MHCEFVVVHIIPVTEPSLTLSACVRLHLQEHRCAALPNDSGPGGSRGRIPAAARLRHHHPPHPPSGLHQLPVQVAADRLTERETDGVRERDRWRERDMTDGGGCPG